MNMSMAQSLVTADCFEDLRALNCRSMSEKMNPLNITTHDYTPFSRLSCRGFQTPAQKNTSPAEMLL